MSGAAEQFGNVYALGVELARPVLRGWMAPAVAEAVLVAGAARTTPPQYDFEEVADVAVWLMKREHDRLDRQRDIAAYQIEQRTRALVKRREPPNIVLRDGFDINAAAGTPFAENQVRAIVAAGVRMALATERRRHGAR